MVADCRCCGWMEEEKLDRGGWWVNGEEMALAWVNELMGWRAGGEGGSGGLSG